MHTYILQVPYGSDLPFSTDTLALTHNSILADALGNLVNRVVSLAQKMTDGRVPDEPPCSPSPLCVSELVREADAEWRDLALQVCVAAVLPLCCSFVA
jgi:methionyl-tRNA synthetase